MIRPLFVYGTLRDADVLQLVLGRRLAGAAAVAPGYRAAMVPGRSYPGLLRAPGSTAAGLLLSGLAAAELALLDGFEGEEYRRGGIEIIVSGRIVAADVYWPAPPLAADAEEWRLAEWRARHKAAFLAAEKGSIAELRRRLPAAVSAPPEENLQCPDAVRSSPALPPRPRSFPLPDSAAPARHSPLPAACRNSPTCSTPRPGIW